MTPSRSPWDDGRLDDEGDMFGPGEGDPTLYHVEATVVDTEGRQVEAGEEFDAMFGTASRTEDYAIQRAEMFFSAQGFEVVSDYDTERVDIGASPRDLAAHVSDLRTDEDTGGLSWI